MTPDATMEHLLTIEQLLSIKQNLERVLDNLKEGIIAHDLQRRIFFFNQEAERITGYQREEILGKDCHEAFGQPFCGEHCNFCGDKKTNLDIEKDEYPVNFTNKQGELKRVEMSVTRMDDDDGQPCGVLASLKDVTDLVSLKIRAAKLTSFSNIVGQTRQMIQIFQQIQDVAGYDFPVHIYGETGTGKELVAAAIHNESCRSGAPFVPINCGALPEGLIESELFGHVKGAFSGAVRDKKGRFELADGGTIFLDEVSELSKHMQVKLLRFLQESQFERVGGEKTINVNIRVISATNKNLKKEVQRKNFRDDLFYRLNVVPMDLPPLRERRNDIPLLAEHFLNLDLGQPRRKPLEVSKEALSLMMDYGWPGNVRELQNAIQFAIVKCKGSTILPAHLPMELFDRTAQRPRRGPAKKLDVETVRQALAQAGGNKAKTAKALEVGRATLYRFLDEYPEVLREEFS